MGARLFATILAPFPHSQSTDVEPCTEGNMEGVQEEVEEACKVFILQYESKSLFTGTQTPAPPLYCTLLAWIRAPSAIRLVTSVAVNEVSCSTVFQMAKGVLFIEVSSFQIRGVFPVCVMYK